MQRNLNNWKLIALSKSTKSVEKLDNMRPIVIMSHITKILEKAFIAKIKATSSNLLKTGHCQMGFKEACSTQNNFPYVIHNILASSRKPT